MSGKIYRFMMEAKQQSELSTYKYKIGCVIVSGNKIISKACNEIRYCKIGIKKYAKWENSIHAERNAARLVNKEKLIGSTMYIYREKNEGGVGLSYPCESCFKMIKELKIKRVFFSISEFPYYSEIRL